MQALAASLAPALSAEELSYANTLHLVESSHNVGVPGHDDYFALEGALEKLVLTLLFSVCGVSALALGLMTYEGHGGAADLVDGVSYFAILILAISSIVIDNPRNMIISLLCYAVFAYHSYTRQI